MVLGMEKNVFKIHRKIGDDILVKFKMAAKTAVKSNKCNILALVWSRSFCNTIFSMFYDMENLFWPWKPFYGTLKQPIKVKMTTSAGRCKTKTLLLVVQ